MANPLDILGSIAGGLTTIGAQGASGAFEGEAQGIKEAARLRYMDALNQLNALHVIKGQLEMTQPQVSFHEGQAITKYPGGHPRAGQYTIEALPMRPPTDLQQAQAESARATAAWRGRQAEGVSSPKALPPETAHLYEAWTAKPESAGKSYLDFYKELILPRHQQGLGMRTERDAAGNVTGLISERDASGKWNVTQIPLGPIGAPQRPAPGTTPVETTTRGTKIIPRKEITNYDDLEMLRKGLPNVVNEIAGSPNIAGWNTPGATVNVKGYLAPVRREDVIAHWFKKKMGVDVSVYWDGRSWQLMKAWIPSQREAQTTVRTVGPAGSAPQEEPEDEQ